MIWALQNGEKVRAEPHQRAICPLCNNEVIAKCGDIKVNHWAHKINSVCDSFKESETEWHLNWKDKFPKECQEVIVTKNYKKHIADVRTKDGLVIEFQNSPISPQEIFSREHFWENMVWVVNGKTIGKNLTFYKQKFKWKWMPRSWELARKKVYLDVGNDYLYLLKDIYKRGKFQLYSKEAFIIQNGGNPFKND